MYLKYKTDVFFSTRVKIILFHTLSVTAIVIVTVVLLEYAQKAALTGIVESLNNILTTGTPPIGVFEKMNADINSAQFIVYGIVLLLSVIVGVIATKIALNPVRDSLIVQRRFIASIAHELRTPLAIIKTQNEVARLDMPPSSPSNELLQQTVEEIDHITEILNNLLLFSRVDTFESITFDKVDLTEIVETVIERLKNLARKKGITVTFEKTDIPSVYGNATGLEQMLFNLLKNAVNYTESGGQVTVRCTSITENEVTLCIKDNGIGIAEHELPHIFEPFYRTDSVLEMSRGTGLGLALVFEIIKLHSGKIHVESTLGAGTQFSVSIPRHPKDMLANHRSNEVGLAFDFTKPKIAK